MNRGFTLLELLIVLALATGLGLIALPLPVQHRDRFVMQQAMRRLRLGLDRGRLAAERFGQPCALHLSQPGWEAPATGALPPCRGASMPLIPAAGAELAVHSNLPDALRFSANGLILDGGMVVLSHPRLGHASCLVIALPLGIARTGTYHGDPSIRFSSSSCRPDHAVD